MRARPSTPMRRRTRSASVCLTLALAGTALAQSTRPDVTVSEIRPAPSDVEVRPADLEPLLDGRIALFRTPGSDALMRERLTALGPQPEAPGVPRFLLKIDIVDAAGRLLERGDELVLEVRDGALVVGAQASKASGSSDAARARLLFPPIMRATASWQDPKRGTVSIAGLADVTIGDRVFLGCVVLESTSDRRFYAQGLGRVVAARRSADGSWTISEFRHVGAVDPAKPGAAI